MGRYSNAKLREMEKQKLEKLRQEASPEMQEGETENFKCTITKASNGYIITSEKHTMVYSEEMHSAAIAWIISRRLAAMQEGEVIDFEMTQTFTKKNNKENDNSNKGT